MSLLFFVCSWSVGTWRSKISPLPIKTRVKHLQYLIPRRILKTGINMGWVVSVFLNSLAESSEDPSRV